MFTFGKSSKPLTLTTLLVLGGLSLPANADELARNLGPVGPNEPILTRVGSKRVIAFNVPRDGQCGINVVAWDAADASGGSATWVRVSVSPHGMILIDRAQNNSIKLECGDGAKTLALVGGTTRASAGNLQ